MWKSYCFVTWCLLHCIKFPFSSGEGKNYRTLLECENSGSSYGLESESGEGSVLNKGSDMRNFLINYRGGSDDYYRTLMTEISIASCEANYDAQERYVKESDDAAAKNKQGDCIVTSEPPSDSDCTGGTTSESSAGCCEQEETCYWEAPVEGEDRERKYTDDQATAASDAGAEYFTGIISIAIPGIVFACVVFLGAPIYGFAQCCCKCCRMSPDGYSKKQQIIPFAFFLLFFIGAFISGLLAYIGNQEVVKGLNNMFSYVILGILDLIDFLFGAVEPLNSIVDSLEDSAIGVNDTLNDAGWIRDSVSTLSEMLTTWTEIYSNVDGLDLSSEVDAVTDVIDSDVAPVVDTFIDLLDIMKSSLITGKDSLEELVGGAADSLAALNSSLLNTASEVEDLQTTMNSFDSFRDNGSTSIFSLSIVISGIALIWMLMGKFLCHGNPCAMKTLNITWVCNWLVTILAFLIAALALTFAVLWSDACEFIDIVAEDFTPYLGDSAGGALNACLNDSSLVEAFNLSSTLDFGTQIEEAAADAEAFDVNDQFSGLLTELAAVDEIVDSSLNFSVAYTTFSTYTNGEETFSSDDAFGGCSFSETYLTEDHIIYPWDANSAGGTSSEGESFDRDGDETSLEYMNRLYDQSNCPTLAAYITTFYASLYNSTWTKWEMRADYGYDSDTCSEIGCPTEDWPYSLSIYGYVQQFQANLTSVQNELDAIVGELTSDLISHVDDFLCNTNCGFIGDFYGAMYDALCVTTLGGFGQISISLYLLAIFNIPIMITTCILTRRLRKPEFQPPVVVPTSNDNVVAV